MPNQLAFIRKAGMIIRNDALQLLDSFASVVYADSLILNDLLKDFNPLNVLSRVFSCFRINLCKLFLCTGLSVHGSHDSHTSSHHSRSKQGIDVSQGSATLLQLTQKKILPCPITR